MATEKYFYLDKAGLAQYDGLIKQYIDTEDAKSIKYLTFEPAAGAGALPTTIRFWKVDPSVSGAVAAYTVTLPDATTLMTKVVGGTTGNLVKLDANGQVVDANVAASDVLTKFTSATANTIIVANADGTIATTNVLLADIIKKSTDTGATFTAGQWAVFDNDGNVKGLAATAANVSYSNTIGSVTVTNVDDALDELVSQTAGGVASKTVYMANGSSQQYAAVYNIYQGATGSSQNPDPTELIGTINIPKDLVVESGSVVEIFFDDSDDTLHEGSISGPDVTEEITGSATATAADAGQYIKLTIANTADTHLWIKATDLVDVYTGGDTADIEVDITNNVITATLTTTVQNKLTLATTALQPVSNVTADNIVTFTNDGHIQDSGTSIADITEGIEDVIAPAFSTSSTYDLGDYVIYNGKLYECTTAVSTAGAWDSNDWTESKVMTSFQPIPSSYISGLFS